MLELMYATGIRVSELVSLTIDDINVQAGYIRCSERGRERIIPIGSVARISLRQYLKQARPAMISDDSSAILFPNYSGQPMSRQGFWKILKQYAAKAGLNQISHRIRCVILLLRTFLKMVLICVPFRKCSVIPIFLRHRFTLR